MNTLTTIGMISSTTCETHITDATRTAYAPFVSVEHIMRDVEGGRLLRYMHANGSSMEYSTIYHRQPSTHYAIYFIYWILTKSRNKVAEEQRADARRAQAAVGVGNDLAHDHEDPE